MAFNLRAQFRVEDDFSPKIKRSTKEVKRLYAEVNKANKSFRTLTNTVQKTIKSFDRTTRSIQKITTATRTLSRAVKDVERHARGAENSFRRMRVPRINNSFATNLQRSSQYMRSTTQEATRLNSQLNRTTTHLKRIVSLTRQVDVNFRNVNSQTSRVIQSINRASTSAGRLSSSFQQAEQSARRVRETSDRINVNNGTRSVGAMKTQVAGLLTLLGSVLGINQTLKATIGGAANFEASSVLIEAMFNDKKASNAYMKMLQKMAADSPVLNSGDMFANSKSFISLSKDAKVLKEAWKTVEKLTVLDPIQGVEGAVLAMRELAGGDVVSLAERFEMPRKALNEIKGLSFDKQVVELQNLISEGSITDKVIKDIGGTTVAQWNQVKEKMEMSFREMGMSANSELRKALTKLNKALDGSGLKKIVTIGDKILGKTISGLIDGFGALGRTFERISNSKMVETIGNIKEAVDSLMTGEDGQAASILKALGLNPGQVQATINTVNMVKDSVASAFDWIKDRGKQLSDFFTGSWPVMKKAVVDFWGIAQPILQGFWSIMQTVGMIIRDVFDNILMPALKAAVPVFNDLWSVAAPILKILGETFKFMADSIKSSYENTISPILSGFQKAVQQIDSVVMPILDKIAGGFSKIGDAAKWAADKMGIAIGKAPAAPHGNPNHKPKTIKPPKAFRTPRFTPRTIADPGRPPGFSKGLANVPVDEMNVNVHKEEAILRADQANSLRRLGVLKSSGGRPVIDTTPFKGNKGGASSSKDTGTAAPTKQHITINGGIHIHGAQKTTKQMARELVQNIQHVIAAGGA